MDLEGLNKKYKRLTPRGRIIELYKDFDETKILYTSSFGTTAAILLKLIHEINPNQNIFYITSSYRQAKMIAWRLLKEKLLDLRWIQKVNESELTIFLPSL